MKFTKMHGIGNDYVYVNCFEEDVSNPGRVARLVSPRHFGVGADGLILITPSKKADVGMRIFNADGSEAEMCGNGIRCVAKYAYEHGLVLKKRMTVETLAGIKTLDLKIKGSRVRAVRVNMGSPNLLRKQIPTRVAKGRTADGNKMVIEEPFKAAGKEFKMTCVSMGNPHCIIFLDKLKGFPVEKYGPLIERHRAFPERTNVHFVEVLSRGEVQVKTWERGSGQTLACGTGAAAVCVAGVLNKRTSRKILAHLPGGDLTLEWSEDGDVFMTGPAEEVFEGEIQDE